LAIIRFPSLVVCVLIVAIGTHRDEEGNHKHISIEWRHQVSIPVQAYASDEKEQKIDNEAYWPAVGMMIGFLLSYQPIPEVVDQVNDYRQSS
jgi:hypothetical protein